MYLYAWCLSSLVQQNGFKWETEVSGKDRCYWLPVPQKPREEEMLAARTADRPDSLHSVADVKEGRDDSSWLFLPKNRPVHVDETQKEKRLNAWQGFLLQWSHTHRLGQYHTALLTTSDPKAGASRGPPRPTGGRWQPAGGARRERR